MTQLAIDIRVATVATLLAQNTLAGTSIESDRVDGVVITDLPRLIVHSQEEGQGASQAGGPPAFEMTLTLVVQALVQHATLPAVVADLDTLIMQTQLGLLEDPVWNRLAGDISSMRVTRTFTKGESVIEGDGRIEFLMHWREDYQTRLGPMISGVDLYVDTGSPFDANGDYANTEFPAAPSPRAHGPDGRYEIAARINLPVDAVAAPAGALAFTGIAPTIDNTPP